MISADARWLQQARSHLRAADPVLARLIDDRPDFDPRAWMAQLPPMDLFGALLFQVTGQQLSVPRPAEPWPASRPCLTAIFPRLPSCWTWKPASSAMPGFRGGRSAHSATSPSAYPVVTVADEMPVAHAVDLDWRDRLTAPLGQRQPLPAGPDPARGGLEAAVEVAPRAGGAVDRVEPDCLQPQLALAAPAE